MTFFTEKPSPNVSTGIEKSVNVEETFNENFISLFLINAEIPNTTQKYLIYLRTTSSSGLDATEKEIENVQVRSDNGLSFDRDIVALNAPRTICVIRINSSSS